MKTKKIRIRQGFTIVELVIVIGVVGVLAAVLIPTFINLNNKANRASDESPIKNLNTALAMQEQDPKDTKNVTMHDAVEDLKEYGYLLPNLVTKSEDKLLWNQKTNRFLFESDDKGDQKPIEFWRIQDSVKGDEIYSVYAGLNFEGAGANKDAVTVKVGFDVGDNEGIKTVNYTRTEETGQEVIIRTNSAGMAVKVNAPHDIVHHYGSLGALSIEKTDTASYHENGKVAYAEIAYGRIVLEKGSDVHEIHINKKTDSSFDTVIIANNGGTEELPERITRDAVSVSEQTLVVKVETNGASENVYVYANGDTGTTQKITEGENKQNEGVNSPLGQLVLDNGSAGEKAQTVEQKEAAKTEAVNEAIESTEFKGVAIAKTGETTQLLTLEAFRDSVNAGNSYAGYTVKLLDYIDLGGATWTPIGNDANPFSGSFDGQGYSISNFKVSLNTQDAGLFGVIRGVHSDSMKTRATQFWDDTNVNLIFGSDSEAPYATTIKNVTLRGVDVSATEDYVGGLAGYAIDAYFQNISVASGSVYAKKGKVGGVLGSSNGCSILNNLSTGSELTVTGDKHTIGGIVGGIQRGYTDEDHKVIDLPNKEHMVLVENCVNNAHVVWDQNPSHSGLGPIGGIIGNAGSSATLNAVAYKCTNNGNIDAALGCPIACGIIGQAHSPVKVIYGCVNNGNITGDVYDTSNSVSGIAGITCVNDGAIIACSNAGTLTNTHEGGHAYDIGSSWRNIRLTGGNYQNVSELQTAINNSNNDTCKSVVLKNVTVADNTGTLTLPANIETISSDTKVCDDVNLSGSVKGIYLKGLTQKVNVTRTIVFGGSENTISVDENQEIGNIHLQGTNNSFVNNGTMGVLTYGEYGGEGVFTAINNGTMGGFASTTGASRMTFTNNGVVSRDNWHTFDIETAGSLTIHNYGTIHGGTSNPYALLFYGSCDVIFYAHSGSIVEGNMAAYSKTHTVNIYAEEGTTINGRPWSSVASETYHVIVHE